MIKGYLAPELTYFNKNEQPHLLPVNSELISNWEAEFANHKTDFKVLLFRGNPQELQQFEDSSIFDLIVAGSTNDDELKQVMKMRTSTSIFPMIPTKGQGLLSGKLSDSGKIIPEKNKTVPAGLNLAWLRSNLEDARELDEIFRNYNL